MRHLVEKAAALGFSLIKNHPFADGNKRPGHAVMDMFLTLNGHVLQATVDEQVDVVLRVASGELGRTGLLDWLRARVVPGTP
jgi:death-on-curing protein